MAAGPLFSCAPMILSDQQNEAIRAVAARLKGDFPEPMSYIGGYAGSGKSTILPFLLEEVGYDPHRVAFMAPTGKAAKVMRKKLAAQNFPNKIATTIHSAIYRTRPAPVQQLEQELFEHQENLQNYIAEGGLQDSDRARRLVRAINNLQADLQRLYMEDKFHFQLNVDSAIANAQVIVVDEASMVGADMTEDLMSFGVPIIAMGDPGQLPPIGDKPGLTANRPDYFLTEIHRQAAENPIIHLATLARQGKELPPGEYRDPEGVLRATVMRRREYDCNPLVDQWREAVQDGRTEEADLPQVIVGTNRTRYRITQMFREGLPMGPTQYEPLIVRKNSREHPGLVNGAMALCLSETTEMIPGKVTTQMSFRDEDGATYEDMTVYQGLFEEHHSGKKHGITADQRSAWRAKQRSIHLDYSYALTVHNTQGSQYNHVVLIDESAVFKEDCDKHLYTGLTRAAETITVLT